ncbi:MAG TPA: hypothetical protein VNF91_08835 [Candidatus Acidoferrum sp.]|nr:hypothetical protein [Candidatus Acidoferrum sp.]
MASTGRWWGKPFLRSQVPGRDAITVRRRFFFRNIWMLAVVRFVPTAKGTLLRVKLRSPYSMTWVLCFWIGIALVLTLYFLSKVQVDAFLVSLVAFALGFGVLALDRKLMRPDGPILLEFIRQTLDAQDIGLVSWPQ